MSNRQEFVGTERKHLKSVREKLSAAVAQKSNGDVAFVPFYVAIADYMEASMTRLHAQDTKLGELIDERTEGAAATRDLLGGLAKKLSASQSHLDRLLAAREAIKRDGAGALEQFEVAGEGYTRFITTEMGHQGKISDLAGQLLTPDDWTYMAGVTDEAIEREKRLFDRVTATVPPNLQLTSS